LYTENKYVICKTEITIGMFDLSETKPNKYWNNDFRAVC